MAHYLDTSIGTSKRTRFLEAHAICPVGKDQPSTFVVSNAGQSFPEVPEYGARRRGAWIIQEMQRMST